MQNSSIFSKNKKQFIKSSHETKTSNENIILHQAALKICDSTSAIYTFTIPRFAPVILGFKFVPDHVTLVYGENRMAILDSKHLMLPIILMDEHAKIEFVIKSEEVTDWKEEWTVGIHILHLKDKCLVE